MAAYENTILQEYMGFGGLYFKYPRFWYGKYFSWVYLFWLVQVIVLEEQLGYGEGGGAKSWLLV